MTLKTVDYDKLAKSMLRRPDQRPLWEWAHDYIDLRAGYAVAGKFDIQTCLWLKGLPKLKPTNILPKRASGLWDNQTKDGQNKLMVDGKWIAFNDPRTAKLRGKTYKGIAEAMANQWG